jgi:hypothetical protein|tara:strand:- start:1131 stop:1430 length:300 start_codon:yes stop_codon:yes gene_type:complete
MIYLAYLFAGAFLCNAIPHFVSGTQGRPFQTPFAKPRGVGLSPAWLNIVWGGINLVLAYGLAFGIGNFELAAPDQALAFAIGFLGMGFLVSRYFARFHG